VKNVLLGAYSSDVVETVTFETETWLKLRDRDRDFIKTPRLEIRDRDSRLQILCILLKFFKKCRHRFWPWASARGQTGIPPLEVETKHKDSPENMKLVGQFRYVDLIFAMPLYFPVWRSPCTTAKFTVLVSCSGELAIHSCSLLCVAKLGI